MKRLVVLFYLLLLLSNCNKTPQVSNSTNLLYGEWEWYLTRSMVLEQTPQSTGKDYQLILNPDGTFTMTGTLRQNRSGYYRDSASYLLLQSFNYTRRVLYVFKSSDSLSIDNGSIVDAPIDYFVRKR